MMELGRQEAKVYFFDENEFNNDFNLYKSSLKENWDSYFVDKEIDINVIDIIKNNNDIFYVIDYDILWLEVTPSIHSGVVNWHGSNSRLFSVRGLKRKSELSNSEYKFINSIWKILERDDKIKKILNE